MNVSQWPTGVNTRFYNYNSKPKDNTQLTTFLSGRTIGVQNNTKKIMTYSMSLCLNMVELELFWIWFNDVLGQTAGAFTCSALGNKTYRFSDIPNPQDDNLNQRVLSLTIEDIY